MFGQSFMLFTITEEIKADDDDDNAKQADDSQQAAPAPTQPQGKTKARLNISDFLNHSSFIKQESIVTTSY